MTVRLLPPHDTVVRNVAPQEVTAIPEAKHGLIANSLGGLAGVAVAAALTANMTDDDGGKQAWVPPFQLGFTPLPQGGAAATAYGTF